MLSSHLDQTIIPEHLAIVPPRIALRKLTPATSGMLVTHIWDQGVEVLGVSLRIAKDGAVDAITFATSKDIFLLSFRSPLKEVDRRTVARILDDTECTLAGFAMARIALHLYRSCGVHVRGVDLSTLRAKSTRVPQIPAEFASEVIHPDVHRHKIHALWYHDEDKDVCLRAWLSAVLAEKSVAAVECARRVDTMNVPALELQCVAELMKNVELLDAEKPTRMENEFEDVDVGPGGEVVIRNERFKTRVRPSKQTAVFFETSDGQSMMGHAVRANGRQTGVRLVGGRSNAGTGIACVSVVGREGSTTSELARDEFVLLLLQRVISSVSDNSLIQRIWFPMQNALSRPSASSCDYRMGRLQSFLSLNNSQKGVVRAMWTDEQPLVIAHGPPGTGKTTTIAAAIEEWDLSKAATWIIAQSNVGVKNIARTLVKYDIDFKLIVSKEFHFEWHEHLYGSVEDRLIRSDELFSDVVSTERLFGDSTTVLCTLAMLSNPALDNAGVFRIVPVERLIVDEASQIDSFEFMHLFHKFKNLKKVAMFGDPKQLPPYGKDVASDMKTIFDFKHLKASAYFLNTQYRMPVPLGDFISEEVYNSKLRSSHKIVDQSCVRLVDVRKGYEKLTGSSWKNVEEIHAVVNLVKNYYHFLDFCVITPYDAQRAAITEKLKAEGLPWECVFNVDSFQGHEASYVIVSTVRTTSAGFLHSLNRMNVMLTRCKAGMVLVTNRAFLSSSARETLLGRLAQRWSKWRDAWVDPLELSDQRASLPGAPGRYPSGEHFPNVSTSSPRLSSWSAMDLKYGRPTFGATRGILPSASRPSSTAASESRLDSVTSTPWRSTDHTRLAASMTGLPVQSDQDSFPVLGDGPIRSKPIVSGAWQKGSKACRL